MATYQELMDSWNKDHETMINTPPNAEHFAASDRIKGYSDQMYGLGQYASQGPVQGAQEYWTAQNQATAAANGGSIPPGMQSQAQSQPQARTMAARPQQQGAGMMGGVPQQQAQGAMGNMQAYGTPNSQVALNSGFGSVQGVTDAMMGRLQPQMDQARQAEISRLKAQGIPENSPAWSRAMDTLNRSDVDARNQGLLAGTAENNNIFNRGLAQNNQVYGQNLQNQQFASQNNQQAFGQRFNEAQLASQNAANQANQGYQQGQLQIQQRQQAMNEANNPYQQMMWMNSMQQGNPVFGNVTNAGLGGSTDYSQAGKDTYQGLLGNYNAKAAENAAKIGGIGQLAGGIGSSLVNNPNAVGNVASNVGGLIGGIGDAAKTIGGWFS